MRVYAYVSHVCSSEGVEKQGNNRSSPKTNACFQRVTGGLLSVSEAQNCYK